VSLTRGLLRSIVEFGSLRPVGRSIVAWSILETWTPDEAALRDEFGTSLRLTLALDHCFGSSADWGYPALRAVF
jgi:hypothetical protein